MSVEVVLAPRNNAKLQSLLKSVYTPKSKDEIASLAASFNRMRRSLANAMKLLGD